jgi:heat shock protein HslJ
MTRDRYCAFSVATLFAALAAACAADPQTGAGDEGTGSGNELAGTSWRLVEFQSMDDAVGTTRPDDPALYTLTLDADGTAALRLNCNRASGTWTAAPTGDGTSGGFTFGPLAMTRAFCPPPSMDQSIAAQAEFVRSFVLRDGRLYLSLMADGGILVWER